MIFTDIAFGLKRKSMRVLRGLYVLSIFLAVLQFGAVRPFPITISTIFAGFVALLSVVTFGGPNRGRWLFVAFLLLGASTFGWVWIQSLRVLPARFDNTLWNDLAIASIPTKGAISIVPDDSIDALLFVALPLFSFLTGLIVIRSDEDARMIVKSLAIGGSLCALYGLIQFSFFPNTNLFFLKQFYLDSLTTTFVNRNTAGTFLGIATLLIFRYTWSLGKQISVLKTLRHLFQGRKAQTAGLRYYLLMAFLFGCTVTALMLTKSRGATACSFIALGFMAYFLLVEEGDTRTAVLRSFGAKRKAIFGTMSVLIVVIVTIAVFGGKTLLRAEAQGGDDARYCVLPGIVELAKGEPIFGYGFGSFRYAFPPFRDPACGLSYIWDRAHNVFFDGFIGLGVLFPALLLVGGGSIIIAHIIGLRERHRMRSYSVMGIASIILIGLHSLVDFSIQIPGCATYLAAVLAATSSISLAKSSPSTKNGKRNDGPASSVGFG